jgi:hypothetical protein
MLSFVASPRRNWFSRVHEQALSISYMAQLSGSSRCFIQGGPRVQSCSSKASTRFSTARQAWTTAHHFFLMCAQDVIRETDSLSQALLLQIFHRADLFRSLLKIASRNQRRWGKAWLDFFSRRRGRRPARSGRERRRGHSWRCSSEHERKDRGVRAALGRLLPCGRVFQHLQPIPSLHHRTRKRWISAPTVRNNGAFATPRHPPRDYRA